jgi:hypothetical protein
VGYSCKPSEPDSAGLVALTIAKKEQEVKNHQQQLVEVLQKIFGSKPNVAVFVEGLKPLPEDKYVHNIHILYTRAHWLKQCRNSRRTNARKGRY